MVSLDPDVQVAPCMVASAVSVVQKAVCSIVCIANTVSRQVEAV